MSLGNLGSFEAFNEWSPLGDEWDDMFSSSGTTTEMSQADSDAMQLQMLQDAGGTKTEMSDARTTLARRDSNVSSGVSATDIMGGIGAILGPLVQAGTGIYAAHQQMELQKDMMKAQRGYSSGPMPMYLPPPPQKSPALIIVMSLVGLAIVGGMIYMMTRGGGESATYAPQAYKPLVAGAAPASVYAPPPAPRVKRVRRIRKRRKRRPPSKKK